MCTAWHACVVMSSCAWLGPTERAAVVATPQVSKGWVQLKARRGWVLIDGDVVGLGQLLQEVPVPEESIKLRFCRPDNGELLHEAQIPYNTTVGQVRETAKGIPGPHPHPLLPASRGSSNISEREMPSGASVSPSEA